jgi:hypothetical protein
MTMEMAPKQSPKIQVVVCVTLGFSYGVNYTCGLLGFYAAKNDTYLPTFQDNALPKNYNFTLPKIPIGHRPKVIPCQTFPISDYTGQQRFCPTSKNVCF